MARYHPTNVLAPSKVGTTTESSAGGGVIQDTVTLVSELMRRV